MSYTDPEFRATYTRHRAELERLIATAPAIDPDLEPPSLETLLAGTEFADQIPPAGDSR